MMLLNRCLRLAARPRLQPALARPLATDFKQSAGKLFDLASSEYNHKLGRIGGPSKEYLLGLGFTRIDAPNALEVRLKRVFCPETVIIAYRVQKVAIGQKDKKHNHTKEEDPNKEEMEDEITVTPYKKSDTRVRFSVTVRKLDWSGTRFDCESKNGRLRILSVTSHGTADLSSRNKKVQRAVIGVLETYGVDERLAKYIELSSQQEEHDLYMDWLGRLKKFAEKLK